MVNSMKHHGRCGRTHSRDPCRVAAGLYFLALHGALTLPDICGALESDTGTASGAKYKAWLRANVPGLASDAELIYGLRCSLLHVLTCSIPSGGRDLNS